MTAAKDLIRRREAACGMAEPALQKIPARSARSEVLTQSAELSGTGPRFMTDPGELPHRAQKPATMSQTPLSEQKIRSNKNKKLECWR